MSPSRHQGWSTVDNTARSLRITGWNHFAVRSTDDDTCMLECYGWQHVHGLAGTLLSLPARCTGFRMEGWVTLLTCHPTSTFGPRLRYHFLAFISNALDMDAAWFSGWLGQPSFARCVLWKIKELMLGKENDGGIWDSGTLLPPLADLVIFVNSNTVDEYLRVSD